MAYRIVKCRWAGEHYRMLVDRETGLPPPWPTLYITTQLRNRGDEIATMEAALRAIKVLLEFAEGKRIDLEERVLKRKFLTTSELDGLCDVAHKPQGKSGKKGNSEAEVSSAHLYNRLTWIAGYLKWLAHGILDNRRTPHDDEAIGSMLTAIRERRPHVPDNDYLEPDRGLSDPTYKRLMEVIEPIDPSNPFKNARTAERNALAIHLLAELGVRRGELLVMQVNDIDWQAQTITIHRRPDNPHDPRMHQPRTKTLARKLPLSDNLIERLNRYVRGARRRTKGAKNQVPTPAGRAREGRNRRPTAEHLRTQQDVRNVARMRPAPSASACTRTAPSVELGLLRGDGRASQEAASGRGEGRANPESPDGVGAGFEDEQEIRPPPHQEEGEGSEQSAASETERRDAQEGQGRIKRGHRERGLRPSRMRISRSVACEPRGTAHQDDAA